MQKPEKSSPKGAPKGDKAIHYNENAEAYANSGKVEPNARKAVQALDDEEEAIELQKAETIGKSHANRPQIDVNPKKKPKANSSAKPNEKSNRASGVQDRPERDVNR